MSGPGPARAENALPVADNFGLDEQFAEGWMGRVAGRIGHDHFGVACHLDRCVAIGNGS